MKMSYGIRWLTQFWLLKCLMSQVETPLYQTTGSELRMEPNSQWQLLNPLVTHWLSCDSMILMLIIVKISLQLMTTQPVAVQLPQGFGGAEQKLAITFSLRDRISHWMLPPFPHSDKIGSSACMVRPEKVAMSAQGPGWILSLWSSVFYWVSGFLYFIPPTQQKYLSLTYSHYVCLEVSGSLSLCMYVCV